MKNFKQKLRASLRVLPPSTSESQSNAQTLNVAGLVLPDSTHLKSTSPSERLATSANQNQIREVKTDITLSPKQSPSKVIDTGSETVPVDRDDIYVGKSEKTDNSVNNAEKSIAEKAGLIAGIQC